MAWFTDTSIVTAFPSAAELSPAAVAQAGQDAATIYKYTVEHPGVSDGDLRAWTDSQKITPDRVNAALGLLQDAGRLFDVPATGPLAPAGAALEAALTDLFTAEELRAAAKRASVDIPKSATKAEIAAAITTNS